MLDQLEDPRSDLSHVWDREHDRFLASRMLELVAKDVSATTWEAFHLHALEGLKVREAARLGISDNTVLIATSRIMKRLRQEAEGFIEVEKTYLT